MFNLNKLINKTEKKNKNNPKTQDKGKKKGNECSRAQSLQSNESQGSKKISSFNINEDVYALQYKGESAFFAQDSRDSSELLSTINNALQSAQTRYSCFPLIELSIEGCNPDKLSPHINQWVSSLLNTFMTPLSQQEKETSCDILEKLIPMLNPSQEATQLLTTLINHVVTKNVNEEMKNDTSLLSKMKLLNEFLVNLPSICGQHKGKLDKFFNLLIDHKNPTIQELAAQCLAMVPCTGGVGSSGLAHQEAWSATFDKVLNSLKSSLTSFETELTKKSEGTSKNVFYCLTHKITGLAKTLIALLMQPQVKQFESKGVFDLINQLLNMNIISELVKPYILQLHQLAFSILEVLLSRYCEVIALNSSLIFDYMNQTLRDTSRKATDEKPRFCSLRKSVYICLKLCFLYNIFPSSMTPLESVIKASVKDCIFPIVIANTSTTIANKMKISASSHEVYSKKRKRGKNLDSIPNDQLQTGRRQSANSDEIDMCVAALEALNCFITCDSKLLQLSILTEDKTVYPIVPSEESKRKSIMNAMVMPIWRFIIPLVRKLQGLWDANPLSVASSSIGIYNSVEVKKAVYQLLGSLISLPLLRDTEAFNAACQIVRTGSHSASDREVQQLCRQTLQWLSFTIDHERHLPAAGSLSAAAATENDIIPMEEMEEDDVSTLPTFNDITAEKHDDTSMNDAGSAAEATDKKIAEETCTDVIEKDGAKLVEKEIVVEENVDQKNDETVEDDVICGDEDDDYVETDSDVENELAESDSKDKETDEVLHRGRTLDGNEEDATKEKVTVETVDLARVETPIKGHGKRKLRHEVDEDKEQIDAKRSKVSDDFITSDKTELHQQEAAKEQHEHVDIQSIVESLDETWQ